MKIDDYFGIQGLKSTQIEVFPSTCEKNFYLFKVEDPKFSENLKAHTYYCIIETNIDNDMRKIIPYLEEDEAQEIFREYSNKYRKK